MRAVLLALTVLVLSGTAEAQGLFEAELGSTIEIDEIGTTSTAAAELSCKGNSLLVTNHHDAAVYVAYGKTAETTIATAADIPILPDRQALIRRPRGYTWLAARTKTGTGGAIEVTCGSGS